MMIPPPPLEHTRNRREINKSNTKIYVLGTKIRIPAHHGLLGFSRFGNEFFLNFGCEYLRMSLSPIPNFTNDAACLHVTTF